MRASLTGFTLVLLTSASSVSAAPFFKEVGNPFGTQLCADTQEGCWTNYLRMTDIDGDGDLDLLLPNADGYFDKGEPQPFAVYLNDGAGNFSDGSNAIVGLYTGYVRQIAVGDVDGDNDVDLYIPAAWGDADVLLLNESGTFVDNAATHLPGLQSFAGATRFGDVDNDGDLDLLVTEGWAMPASQPVHLYLNDGSGHFSEANTLPSEAASGEPIDLDLFDADGDFDLDLLVDMHGASALFWLNDGAGTFTAAAYPEQSGLKYGPVACDVDGDGDLDVWTDNAGPNYTEALLINDGAGVFTDETAARVSGNVNGADDNIVACIDIDGDGDFDAAIGSLSDSERVLINDGTGNFTLEPDSFPNIGDGTLWFEFGDIDGDGRLDCATAQGESSSLDRLYTGTTNTAVDTVAPSFRLIEALSGVVAEQEPALRFAVVDNATTDEGPRLSEAFVRVTISGEEQDVPARFVGGDLYRAVLPAAALGTTVSYAVCATDRQNNAACSEPLNYEVGGSGAGGSGSGGSGAGGNNNGGQGAGGNDDDGGGSEEGCDCALAAPPASRGGALLLAGLALTLSGARRLRRRS
jgi:hypothetical protein